MEAISKPLEQEVPKEKWMITLERLYGSARGKVKRLTKEEKEKIALEHTPERAKELMHKYGLEKFRK